jgi:predicted NBD/HSP70 family sugar kinase
MHTTLGVDIGGSSVKAAVWLDGRCIRTGQSPFYAKPTADQLRASIHSAIGSIRELELVSVGLCAPGLFDSDRRVITFAVNLPALAGLSLDHLVPQALGFDGQRPTTISNDATAAAFDIFRLRRLAGRLLVLSLGTGVGAAVLDNGVPLVVEGDSPGHIGQIDVSIPGFEALGPDGGAGGLEGYIGGPALRRLYGADLAAELEKFKGDEPAIQALVRAMRICHAIYRPHHIFLCGGVGIRLRHLLPIIREKTEHRLTSLSRPHWTLDCGTDNYHAARGAAQLAIQANHQTSSVLVG